MLKKFGEAESEELHMPLEELDNSLKITYSNNVLEIPILTLKYIQRPQDVRW